MTREERRAYIRRIVDAAPPLTAEDADRLRPLLQVGTRHTACAPRPQRPAARTAAA